MISNRDPRIAPYLTPFKYPEPVLQGSGKQGAFDSRGVDIPFVFEHMGEYHMLYTGFDGQGYQSALAVSRDLLHWTHKGVILRRNLTSGRWDCNGGAATWLIKESDALRTMPRLRKIDGRYYMLYHSYPGSGYEEGPAEIGLAWTEDPTLLHWNFLDRPVFSWRDGADWEAGGLYKGAVIRHDGKWYLFYNAKNRAEHWIEQTGAAVSDDLIHWTRLSEEPLLPVTPGAWDATFASDPCVVRDGDLWLNFYYGIGEACADGDYHAQDGLALSRDMLHWEKVRGPIVPYGPPGAADSGHAHKASVFWKDGTLYHFYCGTRPWRQEDPTELYGECRTICVAASRPVWQEEAYRGTV